MLLLACTADPIVLEPMCELDPCVDQVDGLACCIDAHGHGLDDPDDRERLALACQGETCDDARYLSDNAALCVAQTCGLPTGISTCNAWFQLGSSGASWVVENHTEDCDGNMCGGGQVLTVDAETGECSGLGAWMN